MLYEHLGARPRIHDTAVVAPTAVISGDVEIGPNCQVLHGAVITAEGGPIRLGEHVIVMENALIRATAANAVLGIRNGAVVDIGGGTTGVAILRDGEVIANIDEPTGGTHLSLVIAGAFGIPFEEAEKRKVKPRLQRELLPVVRPTLEKVATIVRDAVRDHDVDHITMVGGTAAFFGAADIVADVTGRRTTLAPHPMLVTPVGVASWAENLTR